jgi:hypothetical protein
MNSFSKVTSKDYEFVIQPRLRSRTFRQLSGASIWILACFLFTLRFHGSTRVTVGVFGLVIGIGAIVWICLSMRRTKLARTHDGRLVLSGVLGHRVLLTQGDKGRMVDVNVGWGGPSHRQSHLRLLVGATGHTAAALNRDTWDGTQLEELRQYFDLPLEVDREPKRAAELRSRYPGSVPWWAAHPTAATLLAIGVVVVLVLVSR